MQAAGRSAKGVSTSAAIANEEPKKTDRWGNWEYW